MIITKIFKISGMHCTSCSLLIEGELEDLGVEDCRADYVKQQVKVTYDSEKINENQLVLAIEKSGYKIASD